METLDEKQKSTTTTTTVDRLAKKKAKISFPNEIIEDILLRLPVKSILRFRSLSKPWLSRISDPSFTKLHFTLTPRTALFISAYDKLTHKLHFLSAAHDGGSVTHLITLDDISDFDITEAHYLNGVVFFSTMQLHSNVHSFLLNPSTHKSFKLPDPPSLTEQYMHICYLFGFDESRNEHKVLHIRTPLEPHLVESNSVEIMLFSMSTYSWTKIDAELPVDCHWHSLYCYSKGSVCVNSVVHLMLAEPSFDILAFDLRTNKFSVISTPQGVVPHKAWTKLYTRNDGMNVSKDNNPRIIKIKGCVGVVCHDRVMESNEMHIWMLRDYENRVWVREVITFPKPWMELECPFPLDAVNMDKIMFSSTMVSMDRIRLYIYNKISECFKSLPFTLDYQSFCAKTMELKKINCYVESMLPL